MVEYKSKAGADDVRGDLKRRKTNGQHVECDESGLGSPELGTPAPTMGLGLAQADLPMSPLGPGLLLPMDGDVASPEVSASLGAVSGRPNRVPVPSVNSESVGANNGKETHGGVSRSTGKRSNASEALPSSPDVISYKETQASDSESDIGDIMATYQAGITAAFDKELTSDVGSPNTASEDEGQNEPVVLPDDDEGSPIGSPCSSTSSSSSSESSSSSGTSAGGGNAKPKKLTKKKKRDGQQKSVKVSAPPAPKASKPISDYDSDEPLEDVHVSVPVRAESDSDNERLPVMPTKAAPEAPLNSDSDSEEKPVVPPPVKVVDPEIQRMRDMKVFRAAHLRRDEIVKMLTNLPEDVAHTAIVRSFVRLTLGESCVLAEVMTLEPSDPYPVPSSSGTESLVRFQLRCKRSTSQRLFKLSHISCQDLQESEVEQWKKLTTKTGVDPARFIEQLKRKEFDIAAARNFVFTEDAVNHLVKTKPSLEFPAQQESRLASTLQCAVTQMEVAGMKDNETTELEKRYNEALGNLNGLVARSVRLQDEWFDKRPTLYNLKEINKENLRRQFVREQRALAYVKNQESGTNASLNPFERRPCRPVVAWDTKLTLGVEGLEQVDSMIGSRATPVVSTAVSTPAPTEEKISKNPASRVKSLMQAHRKANLLSKFTGIS